MKQSIYDSPLFLERYLKLRENPISLNEVVEKPTMFSLLPDLTEKHLLDLGCGTGGHLLHYWQLGATKVVGLDLSAAMLAYAKQDFANKGVDPSAYQFYCLPMEQIAEIKETDFDVITSSFAFHYVADLSALLHHIANKLKPGGVLIFSQEHPIVTAHRTGERWEKDAHKQQIAYRLNYYRDEGIRERNWFKQPFYTYHRTISTIINQLVQAGFCIQQVQEPMLSDQFHWHNEFKDLRHRPPLLFIKSVKK